MNTKWLLVPAAAVAIGTGVMATTSSSVSAQEVSEDTGRQGMISMIAERFGKTEEEVKALFEEKHAERQEQRLAALESKLSEAVTAGTITEQQKQLILEKMQTLKQERTEENKADREQRQAEKESKRAELEAWAEANGIDLEFLKSLHEGGPGAGQHLRGRSAK